MSEQRNALPLDTLVPLATELVANLMVGRPYTALVAETEPGGALQAISVMRAKPGVGAWPQDQL